MPAVEILLTGVRSAETVSQCRPTVPAGQVLVRTLHTLVSPGTELSFFEGTHLGLAEPGNTWARYPFRPGYAAVGEVVEAGAGVEMPRVGARVFFFGYHAHWNLLQPTQVWVEVPDDLSVESVLLARLVQIAATGIEVLRTFPQRALVIGAGLIGLFAAQTLKARGCPTVVLQDVLPTRLELARSNGIEHTVIGEGMDLSPARDALGQAGADCVIEATGIAAMAAPALEAVNLGGDVVLLGVPRGEATLNLYRLLVRKNAALLGAHEGMIPDRAADGRPSRQRLIEEAMDGMRQQRIRVEGLVSGHVRPEECQALYENLSRDKSRWITAVIDWD